MKNTSLMLAVASGAVLAGCPDPGGGFDHFVKASEPFRIKVEPGQCVQAFDFSGEYLFGAAVGFGRDKPLRFAATVAVDTGQTPWSVDWSMQALAVADGAKVGDVLHAVGTLAADGSLSLDFGTIVVPGAADTIIADTPVTATFKMSGCTSSTTFGCGTFEGDVSKPTPISLAGSTWGLVAVPEGQAAKDLTLVADCPASPTADGDGDAAEAAPDATP